MKAEGLPARFADHLESRGLGSLPLPDPVDVES